MHRALRADGKQANPGQPACRRRRAMPFLPIRGKMDKDRDRATCDDEYLGYTELGCVFSDPSINCRP